MGEIGEIGNNRKLTRKVELKAWSSQTSVISQTCCILETTPMLGGMFFCACARAMTA